MNEGMKLSSAFIIQRSSLLKVLLNNRRLLSEELGMLVARFHEAGHRAHGLVKRFGELSLLLVAPCLLEASHSRVQAAHQLLKVVVEPDQVLGKST